MVLATSLWMGLLGNLPLWQVLAELDLLRGAAGWGLGVALAVMITASLVALQSALAWRWTLKPVAIFLLIAAAAGAHFMMAYRIVIDSTMLVNVVQTNPREAGDLINLRMVATIALGGLLPAWWVWRMPVAWGRWPRRLGRNALALLGALVVLVAAVLASYQPLSSTMRNHKQVRYLINPLNSVYALGVIATTPLRRDDRTLLPLGRDARLGILPATAPGAAVGAAPAGAAMAAPAPRPPLLLLVLGETARAANFSLNGYARPTTPELARLAETQALINWRNAWSCGTNTAASVPCMFSHLGRDAYGSRRNNHENLLDVAQHAGLAVLWLDNQAGCKGVCGRVPNATTFGLTDAALCHSGECWDEIMLKGLDERIAALPADARARGVLLVMHQMGSHGPAYYKRVPPAFKRFLPECTTNVLQDCNRDQLVNAYDNTIAYTDHFLAAGVAWLQQRAAVNDTALLYVSDHGESLGENNLYLHGLPYAIAPDLQRRVPWVTWLSPGFVQRNRLGVACLKARADTEVSHDHYFHSVLGLLGVQTEAYKPEWDAYGACRGR